MLTIEWICQNMVGTFDLRCKIDLAALAKNTANCTYDPRRFAAAIIRYRTPRVTILVFSTGKCVASGTKTDGDMQKTVGKLCRTLADRLGGGKCLRPQITVQNMVFSSKAPFQLKIDALYEKLRSVHTFRRCFYDPITFPGIRCKVSGENSVSVLIFASGKIICTGVRNDTELLDAGNCFIPYLSDFTTFRPPLVTSQCMLAYRHMAAEYSRLRLYSTASFHRRSLVLM